MNALAFDVNAAWFRILFSRCPEYGCGCLSADGTCRKCGLIIGSEVLSSWWTVQDRGMSPGILFGDSAGADSCRAENAEGRRNSPTPALIRRQRKENGGDGGGDLVDCIYDEPACSILGRALHSRRYRRRSLINAEREKTNNPICKDFSRQNRIKTADGRQRTYLFRWMDRKCTGSPPDGCRSASRKRCRMPDLPLPDIDAVRYI